MNERSVHTAGVRGRLTEREWDGVATRCQWWSKDKHHKPQCPI
jgi:hypothetical protein